MPLHSALTGVTPRLAVLWLASVWAALAACRERAPQKAPAADTPASQANTDGGRMDTATAAFLALFQAPADTVRLRGATALRLWDRLTVPEAPSFDPVRQMNVAATRWEQVSGDRVQLDSASSLNATAHLPAATSPARYVFRLTMRNSSGERAVDLRVLVDP